MGPPASYRVTRVRHYSGATWLPSHFVYGDFTLCVGPFQNPSTMIRNTLRWSTTPWCKHLGLASFPFARRYLGNRCFFLFLELLRCFSSPRFLLACYVFTCGYSHITASEFPHSEICGSKLICSSPQLIAACHVLLRLPVPRHPPCALLRLTICFLNLDHLFQTIQTVLRLLMFSRNMWSFPPSGSLSCLSSGLSRMPNDSLPSDNSSIDVCPILRVHLIIFCLSFSPAYIEKQYLRAGP